MYLIKHLPTYVALSHLRPCQNIVKKWFVQNNKFTPPSMSFAERLQSDLSSPCRKVFVKKNLFISKSWHIACPWRLELVLSTNFLIYVCYLQQTVHFSSQIRTPSFAINLPSVINLCTNMIQINISPKHLLSATRDQFRPDLWCM